MDTIAVPHHHRRNRTQRRVLRVQLRGVDGVLIKHDRGVVHQLLLEPERCGQAVVDRAEWAVLPGVRGVFAVGTYSPLTTVRLRDRPYSS